MKFWHGLLIGFIAAFLLFAGYEIYKYKTTPREIAIDKGKEGQHGQKQQPAPSKEQEFQWQYWKSQYEMSVNSQIKISVKPQGMSILVRAEDDFKFYEKTYNVTCPKIFNRNLIMLQPMILLGTNSTLKGFDPAFGGALCYIRMLTENFGLGAGAIYIRHFASKDEYYGASINGIFSF